MSGVTQMAAVIAAAAIPVGVITILGNPRIRTVHWDDVLMLIGVSVIPMTVVLALEGVNGPVVTMGVLTLLAGHVVAYMDSD